VRLLLKCAWLLTFTSQLRFSPDQLKFVAALSKVQ